METEYKFGEEAEKKKIFIDELKKFPNFEKACTKIGIARSTGYRWRDKDLEFSRAIEDAKTQGEEFITDMAEAQLISAIRDRNIQSIFFWLRAHSARYANKVELNGKLHIDNEPLTDEQQSLIKQALELSGLIQNNKEYEHPISERDSE